MKHMNKKAFIDGFSFVAFIVVTATVVGGAVAFLTPQQVINEYSYFTGQDGNVYYEIHCLDKIAINNPILYKDDQLLKSKNFTLISCK